MRNTHVSEFCASDHFLWDHSKLTLAFGSFYCGRFFEQKGAEETETLSVLHPE
jgi:hypothetical protein